MITPQAAAAMVKDGMTVMIGGFLAVGTPESLVDALVAQGT
ncbi:MAG: CoA-transferase, partial [Sporomusaceae bacterium]|nr:CoA-transferase [Sporomusaceae bacterium]